MNDLALGNTTDELIRALLDAQEALYWHDGLEYAPTDRDGKTVDCVIREALDLAGVTDE